jgi:hypothetical protein
MDFIAPGIFPAMKTILPAIEPSTPALPVKATILSLESPADVARSSRCAGPIYWTCSRPPAQVLGALADAFEGAWIEPARIVVRAAGRRTEYALPDGASPDARSWLAPAIVAHLRSEPAPWSAASTPAA